jgi:hypothetical protein
LSADAAGFDGPVAGHGGRWMGPLHRTGGLVGRAVMYRDIRLGVAVDALLDRLVRRLVGLDVLCGDGAHRFLPFPACDVVETHLAVDSALVFLERDVDFYRAGGRSFSKLKGLPVRLSGLEVGTLADVVVTPAGDVRHVIASTSTGDRELEPGPGVVIGNPDLRQAV